WWFGVGYFLAGLHWIGAALLTDPARYGGIVVPVVLGLSLGLALFTGLAALATHLCRARGIGRVIAFALAWTIAEWLRGHLLTGFPWNLVATVWVVSDAMMQLTALIGAYGLSLLTALAAALPAEGFAPGGPVRRLLPVAAALVILGAIWGGGLARLGGATESSVEGVGLRIVQGNVPQTEKWQPGQAEAHFERYLRLSREPSAAPVTHLVWPETATAFLLDEDEPRRRAIGRLLPPGGLVLVGSVRVTREPRRRFWNSLHVISPEGDILATYDKSHLVPFGEYVPFRNLLKFTKITEGLSDFTAGAGPVTLELDGLPPFSPLICYETIFPGEVVAPARRPAWLVNVTNDAWFGTTSGPFQHFASARLRAVEEGLPLVRAANTGISAIVDPYGRVVARLGLNRTGVLDGPLPQALRAPPPYARWGDAPLAFLIALGALALILMGLRRPRLKRER
ncbi:MAG: apolipoprotein N-acyltransferase, partial [Proteobacteria bacterium]|nr:apolipoprotein N-acyltransferase [Pseudomonadota bacterium]